MTIAAIVLILISVVLHVGWNTISKHVVPTAAFFLVAMLISAVALTPILIWLHASVGTVLLEVWPLLLATSFFAALYNVALASAYRAGDLSLVYPLARSLAPLGVALISVALGRGAEIGVGCLAGIAIIVLGSALLPLDDWTGLALERFRSKAFAGALLTATATAGYTVLDDEALRWLRGSEALELGPTRISLVYAAFHAWVTTGTLGLWVLSRPEERGSLREVVDTLRLPAFAVGIGGYASYILVLVAMAFVDNVTYLAGFRQLSVPLAVGVGFLFLRERVSGPRLAGVALCTAGLIMIVLAS